MLELLDELIKEGNEVLGTATAMPIRKLAAIKVLRKTLHGQKEI